jgi:hypothetical protein
MTRKARTWAAAVALIALIAGGTLAYGQVSGTFAIFNAETQNPNSQVQGSWIPAPSGANSGYGGSPFITETLSWTSGNSAASPSPNPVTGQPLMYANGGTGTSATCPSSLSGFTTTFKTEAAATASDTITGTDVDNWWCFAVYSTSASATTSGSWTSDGVIFTARRIFRATALAQNDGTGTLGNVVGSTDAIQLTFNQNASLSGTISVRICNSQDTIMIGSNALTCGGTANVGTLSGQTQSANRTCNTTIGGSGTTVITLTLTGCSGTSNVGTGTETFTPPATGEVITSASAATLCVNTTTPDCTPSTTTRY